MMTAELDITTKRWPKYSRKKMNDHSQ